MPLGWTSQIEVWEPEHQFVDRQLRGPFGLWHHRHRFEAAGEGTIVIDEVHYAVAFGAVGELADRLFVGRDLERIFAFRHQAVQDALDEGGGAGPMTPEGSSPIPRGVLA